MKRAMTIARTLALTLVASFHGGCGNSSNTESPLPSDGGAGAAADIGAHPDGSRAGSAGSNVGSGGGTGTGVGTPGSDASAGGTGNLADASMDLDASADAAVEDDSGHLAAIRSVEAKCESLRSEGV